MKLDELIALVDSPYAVRIDPVSELTLSYLINLAEKYLDAKPPAGGVQEATVLITTRDKIYIGTTGDVQWGAELIRHLEENDDTQVTHMVTLLRSTGAEVRQGPDVPSWKFRKKLLEMNEKNAYALLVLQGYECLRARTIGSTMPK